MVLAKTEEAAAALLAAITFAAVWLARTRGRDYLAIGWLWYLGTLVPVIGLVVSAAGLGSVRQTRLE